MNLREVARLRLRNQRVSGGKFDSADEAVGWLGAVQSQEYPLAKWSLGKRTHGLKDPDADRLLTDGRILRTHILRPTWHFVLPADIRWMMLLTGPRIAAQMSRVPAIRLPDESVIERSFDVMRETLRGGRRMTRAQLARLLVDRGIAGDEPAATPLFMRAELDLVLCSGGLDGKAQTYALVDERASALDHFDRDWALAQLTRRYFTSHGPASIADFTWWSNLTVPDAKRGLDISGSTLEALEVDDTAYWWAGDTSDPAAADDPSATIHLMQGYDEYIVGYRAPRTALNIEGLAPPAALVRPPFYHAIMLDGQLVGWWRRRPGKGAPVIETHLLVDLGQLGKVALAQAAERYAAFIGEPVEVSPADSTRPGP